MQQRCHKLLTGSLGTQRELSSFHFGDHDDTRVYIQGSLHGDELPGMVVGWHLKQKLRQLESAGQLNAYITIVPLANPIALSQHYQGAHIGRFDQLSGEDFNRNYPVFGAQLAGQLENQLTHDSSQNKQLIRKAIQQKLEQITPSTELESLRICLLSLAHDADLMLDLHCDWEAVPHLYTTPKAWSDIEPLARYLGTKVQLLAELSGGEPFDEACYEPWYYLQQHFAKHYPIPLGLKPVTVELRGVTDVDPHQAEKDAQAIIDFLIHKGLIQGHVKPLPELLSPATPLDACEYVITPVSGVLLHHAHPGKYIKQGELLARVLNPLTDELTPLTAGIDGIYYARHWQRFANAGTLVARIAGKHAIRSGNLLVP
ncbi:MAG: hypothetical protein CENE_02923 [Candidatus Celerinatantimonas neptuna]|nr:MAG: hypothetical protein CENE_02923 [Candidatus Celerinatantimonas neptuna]